MADAKKETAAEWVPRASLKPWRRNPRKNDLRISLADERELRWFLTEAEGALGLASNWEAAVNAAIPGRNKGSKPVSAARNFGVAKGRVAAASRLRWAAGIWERLPRSHRRTLAAVYGPGLTPEAQARWSWLDDGDRNAALLLVTAEREGVGRRTLLAFRAACTKVRASGEVVFKVRKKSLLAALHQEAEVALVQASRAWRLARQEYSHREEP